MDFVPLILAFSSLSYFWCSVISEEYSETSHRRFKRLVYGIELDNHDQLGTQYNVALKKVHTCESAVKLHREPSCTSYQHACGGSLIAPDFVLTACHCIVYEEFKVRGVELPPFHPAFDQFTSSTTDDPDYMPPKDVFVHAQPLHPFYNLMSLWMGNVDTENMPYRQFAKAFYPHSACSWREIYQLDNALRYYKLGMGDPLLFWRMRIPAHDIGFVRTWEPFVINKEVKLVPLKLGDDMLQFHRSILKKMSVCLFTGWGMTEHGAPSRFLRYNFRHVLCPTSCVEFYETADECDVCTSSIARPDKGIRVTNIGQTDSGGPLVCEDRGTKFQVGVVSRKGPAVSDVNATHAIYTSLVCVRQLLSPAHLRHLREINDKDSKYPKMDSMGPYGLL